jgi:AbrB family transcriptional regulator (stage V sporulation protein T)
LKSTGILRKIDELGRIVIPKEIRDNLRIKVGEPLDIFVNGNEIVLKKYSPISKIADIANILVNSLKELTKVNAIITDRGKVVAISKDYNDKYLGKAINDKLTDIINKREFMMIKGKDYLQIVKGKNETGNHLIMPITYNGDCLGLVILISEKEITNDDENNANFVAKCISGYFE